MYIFPTRFQQSLIKLGQRVKDFTVNIVFCILAKAQERERVVMSPTRYNFSKVLTARLFGIFLGLKERGTVCAGICNLLSYTCR